MGFQTIQSVIACGDMANLSELRDAILAVAREAAEAGRQDKIDIELPLGKYPLTQPFVLSAKENPELASVEITMRAKHRGQSEINSLVRLPSADFSPVEGTPLFTYQFPKNDEGKFPLFRDLFLNFKKIPSGTSPRWENPLPISDAERSGEAKCPGFYAPIEIAEKLAAGELGATELMMYVEWEFVIFHVTGTDLSDVREFDGKKYALVLVDREELDTFCGQLSSYLGTENRVTFLQNAPAFLDEENTFAYDHKTGKLYLNPEKREYMRYHAVEYPALNTLFQLEGISSLTLEGISFRGATSTAACEYKYHAGQSNILRPRGERIPSVRLPDAAIFAKDAHALTLRGCTFRDLGCNGILLLDTSRRISITDCVFENVGMCGVVVGNATSKWEEEKNRSYGIHIENNLLRHIGYEYPASPAIYVSMADGLSILHNTIDGCAYTGISAGWGWLSVPFEPGEQVNIRDAEIAYNYINKFMDLLRDGAAIYVLGGNASIKRSTRFNVIHHNYAETDQPGSGERVGYYCDGASSHWDVRDSVVINCFYSIFSQCTVPSACTYHNHFHNIYLTYPPIMDSHEPQRDSVFYDIHVVTEGKEALFEKHPTAKEIHDAAGCRLLL